MTTDEITREDSAEIDEANRSGRTPIVFVHGLWLLPNSWARWESLFQEAGYATLAPGWPDDPQTVTDAKAHPEVFAGKSIGEVADHLQSVIEKLASKPIVIGHSFGALLTQILAGRGVAIASVAIAPAPFRGVLPLPFSAVEDGDEYVLKTTATIVKDFQDVHHTKCKMPAN